MIKRQMFSLFAALVATALSGAALAGSYQLVPGDRVSLYLTALGTSSDMTVDVDGQLRIAGLGGVTVSGATLDEAETLIEEAMSATGVFLSPDVSLSVVAYAPIIIAGDVLSPGPVTFVPGMTIGSALAMSGGSRVSGTSRMEVERARLDNESALRSLNLDLAGAVLAVARLEALLAGAETYEVPASGLARVPALSAVPLAQLQQAEEALFRTTSQLMAEATAAWDEEIALINQQIALLDQRADVLQEVLEATEGELEASRNLNERGLQTATRLNLAAQRNADARARVLDLQSTRVTAVQALAEAQRGRANFLRNRREDWLVALQSARLSIEDSEIRYATRLERQAMLADGSGASLLGDLVETSFELVRAGGVTPEQPLDLATAIRPGDFLVVRTQVVQGDKDVSQ